MTFFKNRLRASRQRRADALLQEIAQINATLGHIDGRSIRADALRTRRVEVWNRRNDLLTKLTKE